MENNIEKFYINGIPVYRTELDDNVEYKLFENDQIYSSILYLSKNLEPLEEYKIILRAVYDNTGVGDNFKNGIRITETNFNNYKINK